MLNVVLFQPEIPPNTGNIIRLAANSGATLTLIEPLGFEFSDSRLKRAGLDYHQWAEVRLCKNFDEFLDTTDETRLFGFSTRGNRLYDQVRYRKGDSLLFGPETRHNHPAPWKPHRSHPNAGELTESEPRQCSCDRSLRGVAAAGLRRREMKLSRYVRGAFTIRDALR